MASKRDMHERSRVGNEIGNNDLQHQRWWRVQVIRDNKNQQTLYPLPRDPRSKIYSTQIVLNPKSSCVPSLVSTTSRKKERSVW